MFQVAKLVNAPSALMLNSHRRKIISIEQLWLKTCLTFRGQKNEVRVEMERDNELQVRHKPKKTEIIPGKRVLEVKIVYSGQTPLT